MAGRRAKTPPLLPAGTKGAAVKLVIWLTGLGCVALALAALASLLTYSATDPTFNAAGTSETQNLLGRPGASFADLALQLFGVGVGFLILAVAAWGYALMVRGREAGLLRPALLMPVTLLLTCAAFANFSPPEGWPLTTGLGGVVGDFGSEGFNGLVVWSSQVPPPSWVGAAIFAILALSLMPAQLALAEAERDNLMRFSGALTRGLTRPVIMLVRRLRMTSDGGMAERRGSREKREPTLERKGGRARIARAPKMRRGKRDSRERQGDLDLGERGRFQLPTLDLLTKPRGQGAGETLGRDALEQNARLLESVLEDFGVNGEITRVRPGPVVTLYELEPAPGTKSSRVIGLADDIARSMSAISTRVAVIPGRNAIGIELPNSRRDVVYLREVLSSEAYERASVHLPLALGKDIGGSPVIVDLANMPHLLVAGTTGSGKSVGLNAMILSLLYRLPPSECRLIMVDPKMLELSVYEGIPHLLTPVVTEPKKAVVALKWAVREMEDRYRAMSKIGVRNITAYNKRVGAAQAEGKTITRRVQTGFDRESGKPIYEMQEFDLEPLPLIVVVIDEMADLMQVAGKDVEASVQRLSQMARAAGVHMIMATQRPSVDVITGTIKANFPTRISFQVTSKIDSRTILGDQGAEQLLGQGDMLYMASGGRITRVHGPFVTDAEVEKVVAALKRQGVPEYLYDITEESEEEAALFGPDGRTDELYSQAVAIVTQDRRASTSYIQRRLKIGYNRAATLMEQLEAAGVVSEANHAGRREVLLSSSGD